MGCSREHECSTNESAGMFGDNLGNVVVQVASQVQAVFRFCPVGEHHRYRAEHLDLRK